MDGQNPVTTLARPGEETTEFKAAESGRLWSILTMILGFLTTAGSLVADLFGANTELGVIAGAVVGIAGIVSKTFVDLGYIKSRTAVKEAGLKALKMVFLVFGLGMVLALAGCGSSEQAKRSVEAMEASAMTYDRNMTRIVDGFIEDYRKRSMAEADRLAEDAVRAETKVVDGVPMANAVNLQIILTKKVEHYAAIEQRVMQMRAQVLAANVDIVHLLKYSEGLRAYFEGKAKTAELMNHTSEQLLAFLQQFVGKKN